MTKEYLPKPYSSFTGVNLPEDEHYLIDSVARRLGLVPPLRLFDKVVRIDKPEGPLGTLQNIYEAMRPNLTAILKTFTDEQ